MNNVLNALLLGDYVISGLVIIGVILSVRRHLPYWPVTRISFAVHLARGSYYAISVLLDLQGRMAEAAQMREAPYVIFLTTAVLAVMCWALYLVVKQNRIDDGGRVDLSGHVQRLTPAEARTAASRASEVADTAERGEETS